MEQDADAGEGMERSSRTCLAERVIYLYVFKTIFRSLLISHQNIK